MNLKDWRDKENLTGDQAAVRLGISQATISRIERGNHWTDSKTLEKIRQGTDGQVLPTDVLPLGEAAE